MQTEFSKNADIGVVVIGRNEGERLLICLKSLLDQVKCIVYVDSGSTDGSEEQAAALGVNVLTLDLTVPFTAARARNEGFDRLISIAPEIEYVQFVDGDCEVVATWLTAAAQYLDEDAQYAVVCGRRRERFPDRTIYNYVCDLEWNTRVGEAKACGGDALMRVKAFLQVDGYRDQLIAGEEPELCVRLRAEGWKIARIDEEMTIHDAAMTKLSQWWRRTVRGGYAFAEGSYLHGAAPEFHWVKETMRARVWALLLPLVILVVMLISWKLGVLLCYIYLFQILRLALKNIKLKIKHPWHLAALTVLGKFAEMNGQLRFYYQLLVGKKAKIIEYK